MWDYQDVVDYIAEKLSTSPGNLRNIFRKLFQDREIHNGCRMWLADEMTDKELYPKRTEEETEAIETVLKHFADKPKGGQRELYLWYWW